MILIDNIIFYLQKSDGVSVVWKELILRLSKDRKDICYLNYKKKPDNICYQDLNISSKSIFYVNFFNLTIQRCIPITLSAINDKFIFHSSYYRYSTNPKAVNITTVHDFTYEYYLKGLKARLHIWQKQKAIRHSQYIICISENTKRDLLYFFPDIDPKKIRTVYNGVSDDYYPLQLDEKFKFPLEKNKYIIFVGSRVSYKNFDFAIDVLSHFPYKLVIVGSQLTGDEKRKLEHKLGKEGYWHVGLITNEDLNILYNYSFTLLYPSFYEGFGIPILEAQKAGCPVIAYNSSSIPEVIGTTPLLLKEMTLEEVRRCFHLLEQPDEREKIRKNGFENAKRFTWDRMYNQILEIYDEALRSE